MTDAKLAEIDVFFSFRSPFSYLATPGMINLGRDYKVNLNLRAVLPLAIREPNFFNPDNLKRARYIMIDFPRRADFLGMKKNWPNPDPIVQDLATLKIASEQPYIHRLTRLGIEAQRRGQGIEFAYEVSHLLFGGTIDWDKEDHLAKASERAGLDLEAMESVLDEGHDQDIEANQKALEAAHHWGVPTFVFEGQPFFGEDRIDTLRWCLDQKGLKR